VSSVSGPFAHVRARFTPRLGAGVEDESLASDSALIAGLRARRPDAVAAFYDRYAGRVRSILLAVLGPDPEVADLLQDVFINVVEQVDRLRNEDDFRAWLSMMTVYRARAFVRSRRRWRLWPLKAPTRIMPSAATAPDVSAALRLTYELLDRLPVDERIPFALRAVDGLPNEQVAAMCHVSLATAKRRVRSAQARLRKLAAGHPILQEWLGE
jgi:RNA polymerase sigma-70 factor (ECF subfamily)